MCYSSQQRATGWHAHSQLLGALPQCYLFYYEQDHQHALVPPDLCDIHSLYLWLQPSPQSDCTTKRSGKLEGKLEDWDKLPCNTPFAHVHLLHLWGLQGRGGRGWTCPLLEVDPHQHAPFGHGILHQGWPPPSTLRKHCAMHPDCQSRVSLQCGLDC